ncbi:MAG: sugar transferase, partial [Epsilonproteobacteria bacterium]|nr:sugar transferase [Campylobacterota bacterium]
MVILGTKYRFNALEIQTLSAKGYRPIIIPSHEIVKFIKHIDNTQHQIVVLNTAQPLPNEIVHTLVSLEAKGVEFLTIEHFLEKYLQKLYIPKDNSNI